MARGAQQDQVVETVRVEIGSWSILVARTRIAVRNDMRHFSDVLVTAQFGRKKSAEAFPLLAMA
jgi:hypothetical protein